MPIPPINDRAIAATAAPYSAQPRTAPARVQSTAGRLSGIEAGRGIAATAVVLCHVALVLGAPYGTPGCISIFRAGWAGVDFFFVLSGFIILFVHDRDIDRPSRLPHYLMRRLTRVMPAYWVALALTLMLGGDRLSGLDLLRAALLLPSNQSLPVIVAWTLQYEVAFYAIFAVLIVNRRLGLLAFAVWFAWIFASLFVSNDSWVPHSLYRSYNIEFFFGMAAAWWLRDHGVPAPRLLLAAGVALFVATMLANGTAVLDANGDMSRFCYGTASAAIVLGTVEAEQRKLFTVPPHLRLLGSASYAIYLFHVLSITLIWTAWSAASLDKMTGPATTFLALAIGGVGGGILMSRLVEHPLMHLLRGGFGRPGPRSPTPAAASPG